MESLAVLSPSISTRLVSSGPRGICLKVLFSHKRRGVHLCADTLCHRWWFKKLDSYSIQPLIALPVCWQVFAATLEGDVDLDVCSTEATQKNEFGETVQISRDERKNVDLGLNVDRLRNEFGMTAQISQDECKNVDLDLNVDALKQCQEIRRGKRYAPWMRKNITVGLDALKPGAILTGMVTNTERFGAFVDVGAFTRGLIHISNLANKFVSSVEDIVKVGQEVRVEVLSVTVNPGRISLKLIREEEPPKVEEPIASLERSGVQKRSPKLIDNNKRALNRAGRPQKGEVVTGSVTKIVSTGVVVTLKEGHEGFLPASEVLSSGDPVDTASFFRVGQQIPVRVLRTTKNRITLTMKKQENANGIREAVISGPEDRAISPFEIAFRRDKVIAKFLEERERLQNISMGKMDQPFSQLQR